MPSDLKERCRLRLRCAPATSELIQFYSLYSAKPGLSLAAHGGRPSCECKFTAPDYVAYPAGMGGSRWVKC